MNVNADILDIQAELPMRLSRYDGLSLLERYAMYMGKAQLLEIGLKKLLADTSAIDFDSMEKWTMGRVQTELKDRKAIRCDFIDILGQIVKQRNHIAHSLLANTAMIASLTGGDPGTKEARFLEKSIIEIEQAIMIFDWCNEHSAWREDS